MNRRSLTLACGLGAAALSLSADARATLFESESFNYPANVGSSVNTLNGGTGWGTNAWADADTDVTLAPTNTSLSYPASSPLVAAGGRIQLSAADTLAQATRSLGTGMNLGTNGQNYYSSALMRRSAETGELSTVSFFGTTNLRWFYGIDANGKFTVAIDPANAAQRATSTGSAAADTTYLVVSRYRTNTGAAGNDEVFFKAFAPGDLVAEPATDAGWDLAVAGNSGVTLDSVRLDFANAVGQTNQFDELRIGTTFGDVAGVPEPATAGLLAAAAIGFLGRRRRGGR